MVVGDDVRVFVGRHLLDARHPRIELFLRIEVVVSLPAFLVREPLLVVASVKAGIRDAAGDRIGGFDRVAEQRLIDIDEADVVFVEKLEELVGLERRVTDFERLRVIREGVEQLRQFLARLVGVFEAPGKLQQERAEAVVFDERVEIVAECLDVRGRKRRLFVSETAEDFGGEAEVGVRRDAADPALRV